MFFVRARFIAFLAALFLVLPAGAFARTQYFCRSMDRVMDDCCCGTDTTRPVTRGAELQRGDCCQLLKPVLHDGIRATQCRNATIAPASLVAILPEVAVLSPPPLRGAPSPKQALRLRSSPILGPPVYLKHCVLLT